MDERRKLDRKYLIVSGAMIISEQPQTVDSVLPLRFDLPDLQLFSAGQLDIAARVAHCEPDINPAFYNIGFEFLDVSAEKKTIIEKMMDAYEFRREIPNYPSSPPSMQNDK
jgi:hypothetical protein